MANIPKANKAKIKLLHAGVNHISEYTGTSLGRISYGTKRVWDVTYTWTMINGQVAEQLYPALLTLGTGQGTIPLFFQPKYNSIGTSSIVGDGSSGVFRGTSGSVLLLKHGTAELFGLAPFDRIQVGNFCLEITGVSKGPPPDGQDSITVANMPKGLQSKLEPNDVVRNYDYFMIGQNLAEEIGYEVGGGRGNNVYEPEVVNFREIII